MKAAIESSKYINLGMLKSLWADGYSNRLITLLHGFVMLTNMDNSEPDAYEEMRFLRDFVAEMEKPA